MDCADGELAIPFAIERVRCLLYNSIRQLTTGMYLMPSIETKENNSKKLEDSFRCRAVDRRGDDSACSEWPQRHLDAFFAFSPAFFMTALRGLLEDPVAIERMSRDVMDRDLR